MCCWKRWTSRCSECSRTHSSDICWRPSCFRGNKRSIASAPAAVPLSVVCMHLIHVLQKWRVYGSKATLTLCYWLQQHQLASHASRNKVNKVYYGTVVIIAALMKHLLCLFSSCTTLPLTYKYILEYLAGVTDEQQRQGCRPPSLPSALLAPLPSLPACRLSSLSPSDPAGAAALFLHTCTLIVPHSSF